MYAVIRTGGKQYKVAQGDVIDVERLDATSDTVEFAPLLVVDDEGRARLRAELSSARVRARVVGHPRGVKVRVFKYRSKTGYRRRAGHRQELTRLQVAEIDPGSASERRASENRE